MLYHLLVSCMHLNALGCVRVMSNNVTRMLHLPCLEAQEPFSPFFSLQPFTILYSSGGAQRAGRSRARAARQRRSRMAAPTRSRLAVAEWQWLLTCARQRQGGARSAAARRPQLLARAPSCGSGETTALARPHSSAVRRWPPLARAPS
jgi:hypothetical protein